MTLWRGLARPNCGLSVDRDTNAAKNILRLGLQSQGRQAQKPPALAGGVVTRPSPQALDYVLMILRYHRPDFDDLPPQERTNLVVDACAHTNELLEALCKLVSFLEHGRAKVYGQGCARGGLAFWVRLPPKCEWICATMNTGVMPRTRVSMRSWSHARGRPIPWCRNLSHAGRSHTNAHLPWRATSRRLGRVIGSQSIWS